MANNEIKEIPADILLGLSQLKHMYVLYYFLIYLIVLMCLWSEKSFVGFLVRINK